MLKPKKFMPTFKHKHMTFLSVDDDAIPFEGVSFEVKGLFSDPRRESGSLFLSRAPDPKGKLTNCQGKLTCAISLLLLALRWKFGAPHPVECVC